MSRAQYVDMYAQDVRENAFAYKESVRSDPRAAAQRAAEGLTDAECLRLLRELRVERCRIAQELAQERAIDRESARKYDVYERPSP